MRMITRVLLVLSYFAFAQSGFATLVGHWDFEGVVGNTVPVKSGNGLNGTIVDGGHA